MGYGFFGKIYSLPSLGLVGIADGVLLADHLSHQATQFGQVLPLEGGEENIIVLVIIFEVSLQFPLDFLLGAGFEVGIEIQLAVAVDFVEYHQGGLFGDAQFL